MSGEYGRSNSKMDIIRIIPQNKMANDTKYVLTTFNNLHA
jgi:hypothetical protein